MYIVVSNANKKPKELDGFQVELWTAQQFYDRASSDEGLDVDEGFWYHTNILTQDIYNALAEFKTAGVDIVYFRYNTDPPSEIMIEGGEKVCMDPDAPAAVEPAHQPEVAPAPLFNPEPEIAPETEFSMRPGSMPSPEPVVEPEPAPAPAPVMQEPAPEPVYSQPEPVQTYIQPEPAPVYSQPEPVAQQPIPQVIPQPQMPQVTPAPQQVPVMPTIPQVQQTPVAPAPVPTVPQVAQPAQPTQETVGGLTIADDSNTGHNPNKQGVINPKNVFKLFPKDESITYASNGPAKVIVFGSAKGGTGKTFTACMGAYWFAKNHPDLRVAIADFDIIDGQVAITTNQIRPTVQGFYKDYKAGNTTFEDLYKYHANSDNFAENLDFYLAPAQDIPEIVKDNEFWRTIFTLLVANYDVVFFDTGIDYMGTQPISQLYKIADKVIITCNTSINSVNSIIKECLTLSGKRPNNVFSKEDGILDRTHIVLTRVSDEYRDVNEQVVASLTKYAPIIAAFGNIDGLIYRVQWGGTWYLIDEEPNITANLERITDISEDE